jgi:endoglucanase
VNNRARQPGTMRRTLLRGLGAVILSLGGLALLPGGANAAITGELYTDPGTGGARWVAANPNDSRANLIKNKITVQPQSRWFTSPNAAQMRTDLSTYVSAANSAGKIPQVVIYVLPNRDCGGASAGGVRDLSAYAQWMDTVAPALGNRTVIVILEPDSLALQTCLNQSEVTARGNALSSAVSRIKSANPEARVYLDGGHSGWNPASEQARRLAGAGVTKSNGFYTNVSNYRTTDSEVAYGQQILSGLGAASSLRQVIDTSRNGAGPGNGDWCNDRLPSTRRLGTAPTLATPAASVDALLWVKLPGEADGCAFTAGSFQPALAYSLAGGA